MSGSEIVKMIKIYQIKSRREKATKPSEIFSARHTAIFNIESNIDCCINNRLQLYIAIILVVALIYRGEYITITNRRALIAVMCMILRLSFGKFCNFNFHFFQITNAYFMSKLLYVIYTLTKNLKNFLPKIQFYAIRFNSWIIERFMHQH